MKKIYINLTLLTSLILIGCGGGGGGDNDSGSSGNDNVVPDSPPQIESNIPPEIAQEDLTEGDELKESSELLPQSNYDFKTYKKVLASFDNSLNMSSGCSILIYKGFTKTNDKYNAMEKDLILESFRSNCVLSGLDLTISNTVENLLIIYSDGNTTKFEELKI